MSPQMILAGNWKMNGLTAALDEVALLVASTADMASDVRIVICPPTTLLSRVSDLLNPAGMASGGQNCHIATKGAHTGDISAQMLKDAGASYVIIGHSERRMDHGETDGRVRTKAELAISEGLVPIICVGETLAERENGVAITVVEHQLSGSVPAADKGANIVIAYEPVWAIGTGRVPTNADIADMHKAIRTWLVGHYGSAGGEVSILYGGSLKPENADEILAVENVNGGLVGGASLKAEDFSRIIASGQRVQTIRRAAAT
ncbi:MAG: triose-phosphate isomerase [Hyphomicrobiaceae bacterium]|nr:triose-phosphate isomerase [Hyphomicrobiaceae bacterium]